MVSENLNNETKIRQFLLGEMREDERAALEESFIAGEDFFEQIQNEKEISPPKNCRAAIISSSSTALTLKTG